MDTTTAMVATGLVVVVGRWADEKKFDSKAIVGVGATAIFLSLIAASNEKLASQFASLILVGAVLIYAIPIGEKLAGGAKQGFGSKPK